MLGRTGISLVLLFSANFAVAEELQGNIAADLIILAGGGFRIGGMLDMWF